MILIEKKQKLGKEFGFTADNDEIRQLKVGLTTDVKTTVAPVNISFL